MNHPLPNEPAVNQSNPQPAGDAAEQLSSPDRVWTVRNVMIGIAWGAAIDLFLVIWTWIKVDKGMADRCATALVMPLGILWTFTLVASLLCFRRGAWRFGVVFAMLFVLISITGNGDVADASMAGLEPPRTDLNTLSEPLRCVVVLGGGVTIAYDDVPELGIAGQRIMHTAQLWHGGHTQAVICTGGSSLGRIQPAEAGRMMLESIGVPSEKIYESPGDNTSQEMKNLEAFFASPPAGFPGEGKIGLVTSASHMKRALRLAAERNLTFVPLPCGYETGADYEFAPSELIPSPGAMDSFGRALKERLARLVNR
ncbi:membrane protein containing DUF218 [Rhodopirellula maiorica SM1]|uniref:Membrane protein containing DUF218 n=1 Tax=Rhodopirellula maiorica SM1 TaxID=1265738 RepID=M5RPM9_9BACT|nr:YdcF family protein [Rhodopirellula maiorica]EMI21176.1 membrane protein containing DUF218 [Rhodopirellula maiorica SM1]